MTETFSVPHPETLTPESLSLYQCKCADGYAEKAKDIIQGFGKALFAEAVKDFKEVIEAMYSSASFKEEFERSIGSGQSLSEDKANKLAEDAKDAVLTNYLNAELEPVFEQLRKKGFAPVPVFVSSSIELLAGAHVNENNEGSIYFNPAVLYKFSKEQRTVIYAHELGHIVHGDKSSDSDQRSSLKEKRNREFLADEFARCYSGQNAEVVKSTLKKTGSLAKQSHIGEFFARCENKLPQIFKDRVYWDEVRDGITDILMESRVYDALGAARARFTSHSSRAGALPAH